MLPRAFRLPHDTFLTRRNPVADRLIALEDGVSPGRLVTLAALTAVVAFFVLTWSIPRRWDPYGLPFWLMAAVLLGAPALTAIRAALYVGARVEGQMFDLLLLTAAPAGLIVGGLARAALYRTRGWLAIPAGLVPVVAIIPWLDALLTPGTYGTHGEVLPDALRNILLALGLLSLNGVAIACGIEAALRWRKQRELAVISALLLTGGALLAVLLLALLAVAPFLALFFDAVMAGSRALPLYYAAVFLFLMLQAMRQILRVAGRVLDRQRGG